MRDRFIETGADPTLEVRWELDTGWNGRFAIPESVAGARVKPVVYVSEELSDQVDRHGLRTEILEAGAIYCKVPTVHVARRKVKRDARHEVELTIEESLRLFAEETKPSDPKGLVKFAAKLARAADSGDRE